MFLATALVYPCVLAVLCAGAGLLTDRCAGGFLPPSLLISVGIATLIALSQLSTYLPPLAPATPYASLAVALVGFLVGRARVRQLAPHWRAWLWPLALSAFAYLLLLAPVLLSGRPSFSSYMALADSAVHMMGADFLIRHGQDYAHLDLHNSYGQFIHYYYGTSYPSGADTLFGGSAFLLGLPLIWAFQPFNAFILASACGPAWTLARRLGLDGPWAAACALTVVAPALVYAYELFGSIKELSALSMILTLGCLVVLHRRWLGAGARPAIPFGLVLAAGVSALGVAFGAWALVAVAVLAAVAAGELLARRWSPARALLPAAGVAITLLIAAWPTWVHVSSSLHVAQAIASTGNSGNLHSPLHTIQVLGVWLRGSYKLAPAGLPATLTYVLLAAISLAALLGALQLLRTRAHALAGWIAGMLLAWLVVDELVTTWAAAKTLMLTSPVLMLLAWGGVAALLQPLPGRPSPYGHRSATAVLAPRRSASAGRALRLWFRAAGALLALAILAGVLVSDALQYHTSNLAPTARYEELASLDARFAGKGPTLFTDFDEYALYELRDLNLGGPDFVYPPPALASAAGGYGEPVDLDRIPPRALLAYPLIVTRRDPSATRPPAAYSLSWQGAYYQLWRRRPGAPAALVHLSLSGPPADQCQRIARLAAEARTAGAGAAGVGAGTAGAGAAGAGAGGSQGGELLAAESPQLVRVFLARSSHPPRWGHERQGLVMSHPGRLSARFQLPAAGLWAVSVQGQIMPTVALSIDGRPLAPIAGELSGNSLVPDTVPARELQLSAGEHRITVQRSALRLAPGDGGSAVLHAIFLTPYAGSTTGLDGSSGDSGGSSGGLAGSSGDSGGSSGGLAGSSGDSGETSSGPLRVVAASRWRALCGHSYEWVELQRR